MKYDPFVPLQEGIKKLLMICKRDVTPVRKGSFRSFFPISPVCSRRGEIFHAIPPEKSSLTSRLCYGNSAR